MSRDTASREFIGALAVSGFFDMTQYVDSEADVIRAIDEGKAMVGLVIPPDFAGQDRARRRASAGHHRRFGLLHCAVGLQRRGLHRASARDGAGDGNRRTDGHGRHRQTADHHIGAHPLQSQHRRDHVPHPRSGRDAAPTYRRQRHGDVHRARARVGYDGTDARDPHPPRRVHRRQDDPGGGAYRSGPDHHPLTRHLLVQGALPGIDLALHLALACSLSSPAWAWDCCFRPCRRTRNRRNRFRR